MLGLLLIRDWPTVTSVLLYAEHRGRLVRHMPENTLLLGSLFSFLHVQVHLSLSNVQTIVFPIIKCLCAATVECLVQLVTPHNVRMRHFQF